MRELLDPKTDWALLVKQRLGTRFRAQVHFACLLKIWETIILSANETKSLFLRSNKPFLRRTVARFKMKLDFQIFGDPLAGPERKPFFDRMISLPTRMCNRVWFSRHTLCVQYSTSLTHSRSSERSFGCTFISLFKLFEFLKAQWTDRHGSKVNIFTVQQNKLRYQSLLFIWTGETILKVRNAK